LHPGLCVFAPPPAWSTVIGRLKSTPSAERADPGDVAAGAEAFLKAVSFDHSTIDRRTIGALIDTR
jgi:hypothetical protein